VVEADGKAPVLSNNVVPDVFVLTRGVVMMVVVEADGTVPVYYGSAGCICIVGRCCNDGTVPVYYNTVLSNEVVSMHLY
jgi:hypothetical protein